MRNDRKIKGALYDPYRPVEQTRAEWQRMIGEVEAAGGKRRPDKSETFLHAKGGMMVAEIYENVPSPRGGRAAQNDDDAMAGEEAA